MNEKGKFHQEAARVHRLLAVLLIRQHSATACGAPGVPSGSRQRDSPDPEPHLEPLGEGAPSSS